ncbi:stalk domain-containing protein [Fimbriimonas ginsengisoli]|uniref:Copper amine oxidase domain protein n=1 Tax=Fimbriimonas ginsengisoli Gsoil 348 TaxID=661478 RepID=A0A068NYU9_FIMGI|nr:stalk domain-containing protein [Fimbriimonas ginsengisoli]AIE87454.1 copper amine oxidase domain protein [Fimbriimonas ginsengisoli Gsoil 348]
MTNKIHKGAALAAIVMIASVAGAQGISVTVDGQPVNFNGASPRSVNGRVLVPLRGVFEEMGAYVQWRPNSRSVVATRGDSDVRLRIGDRTATVDGHEVTLDVPAMIINGATMVPIRFLSESLGAEVRWREAERLVMIQTSGEGRGQSIDQTPRTWTDRQGRLRDAQGRWQDANGRWHMPRGRWQDSNGNWHGVSNGNINDGSYGRAQTIARDTVLPVTLDTPLSSDGSLRGDKFTATVRSTGDDYYGMLPEGTKVEGRVLTARPRSGNDPGLLELDFRRIRLPNGSSYPINGNLISLDANGVVRDDSGRIRATGSSRDNRTVYAGYGAGAGLLVGLLTKKPLEGTILGGVLGYVAGQVQKDRGNPSNVRLDPGTQFGVRLTNDVTVRLPDNP